VFGDYHSDSATNQLEVDTIDEIDSIDPKIRAIIEKFDPLPDSWVWSIVGEVTQSLRNGIYKTKDHYNNDGVPCLRMYNIKNGQIKWYDIKHLDLTDDEFKKYQLRYGDVLVNRVNSRELVGKAAAIPPELDECVYESKNIRLRLNTQLVAPEYVAYWMKIFRREYYEVGMKQTTGQATITQSQLRWMPIPLPPRSVQSDIVSRTEQIRERVSGLNETVSKEIKRAENLRSSVLNSAYQGNMIDINDESRPSKKVTGSNNPETEQITLEDVN
jgi:type I restriction enzyme S subunit